MENDQDAMEVSLEQRRWLMDQMGDRLAAACLNTVCLAVLVRGRGGGPADSSDRLSDQTEEGSGAC